MTKMLILREIVQGIEHRFDVSETRIYEPDLVTLCSAGPKPRGEETARFATAKEAIEKWVEAFAAYEASHPGKQLVWRTDPRLEWFPPLDDDPGGYVVWCRLAIRE